MLAYRDCADAGIIQDTLQSLLLAGKRITHRTGGKVDGETFVNDLIENKIMNCLERKKD